MALLTEGIERGNVRETGRVSKLTIDGISQNYKVYQIRLDELYFNPQNDRIRTWMSSYESNGGEVDPSPEGRPAYNDAVAEFIRQSNPAALKKTRNNIRLYGQEVPAIVLDNGLIIDGNRRFTCLRELAAEDEKFNWIDAMILPANVASDEKRIKQLELAIQFGQEGKVDYNPIDRLAGVYNDILKKRLLTPEEYAKYANMQVREVRDLVSRARLMADFLNFCNRPDDYHLARELEINGALQEMPRLMKKCADSDEAEELKPVSLPTSSRGLRAISIVLFAVLSRFLNRLLLPISFSRNLTSPSRCPIVWRKWRRFPSTPFAMRFVGIPLLSRSSTIRLIPQAKRPRPTRYFLRRWKTSCRQRACWKMWKARCSLAFPKRIGARRCVA